MWVIFYGAHHGPSWNIYPVPQLSYPCLRSYSYLSLSWSWGNGKKMDSYSLHGVAPWPGCELRFSKLQAQRFYHLALHSAFPSLSSRGIVRIMDCQLVRVILGIFLCFVMICSRLLFSALVKRTFYERCMIFIQTKVQAHRMHIVLGLLGVNVGEIHGNLSQTQV